MPSKQKGIRRTVFFGTVLIVPVFLFVFLVVYQTSLACRFKVFYGLSVGQLVCSLNEIKLMPAGNNSNAAKQVVSDLVGPKALPSDLIDLLFESKFNVRFTDGRWQVELDEVDDVIASLPDEYSIFANRSMPSEMLASKHFLIFAKIKRNKIESIESDVFELLP